MTRHGRVCINRKLGTTHCFLDTRLDVMYHQALTIGFCFMYSGSACVKRNMVVHLLKSVCEITFVVEMRFYENLRTKHSQILQKFGYSSKLYSSSPLVKNNSLVNEAILKIASINGNRCWP